VATTALAGLRWGECAGLPWRAVDLDGGRLTVAQVTWRRPAPLAESGLPATLRFQQDDDGTAGMLVPA
jgi:hypothetical protein